MSEKFEEWAERNKLAIQGVLSSEWPSFVAKELARSAWHDSRDCLAKEAIKVSKVKYLNITFTDGKLQTIAITEHLDFDDEGAFIKFCDGEDIYSFRADKVYSWELVVED